MANVNISMTGGTVKYIQTSDGMGLSRLEVEPPVQGEGITEVIVRIDHDIKLSLRVDSEGKWKVHESGN
tara:strand:+ start:1313 stop:1519 length:207 start_codon:yes stop_codon:yes gene_type:complete